MRLFQYINTGLIILLTGCSLYHPMPLPNKPSYSKQISDVTVNTTKLSFATLAPHIMNPRQGLDMTDVAILAVINNPGLKLARDDAKIAAAQSFSAGLLPDPQIDLADAFPIQAQPGDTHGYTFGISYNLLALLTYTSRHGAAYAFQKQTDLNVLWQEWQVISQVQTLFNQMLSQQKQLAILNQYHANMVLADERMRKALQEGNITLDNAGTQLLALQSMDQQINTLTQQLNQNSYALNQLLGLAPDVRFKLIDSSSITPITTAQIKKALNDLASHRPDLLALQSGYQSEELKYRQTIIEQFPIINVGFIRARDTQNVNSGSFGVTLNLPIFNRNRGNIAIEKATRQKLYDDYQQRLNMAYSDVYRLANLQQLVFTQYKQTTKRLKTLKRLESDATLAYHQRDMTILTYVSIQASLMNIQLTLVLLNQALTEQRIALQTLIGPWNEGDKKHA